MSDFDDLLQKRLEAIEHRAPPGRRPKAPKGEADDLDSLIFLASTLRSMPQPELPEQASQRMQKELIATAKATLKPQKRSIFADLSWLFKPGLAALTIVFLGVLVIVFGGVFFSGPREAYVATLIDPAGTVQVSDSSASKWETVRQGAQLASGQLVRTLDGSRVTVRFFDGSQTSLASNTGLILTEVAGGWEDRLQVKLTQLYGFTEHQVVPFESKDSYFTVQTPAGSATVHGTTFSIAVDPKGETFFTVDEGEVGIENDLGKVALLAGQATAAIASQAPVPPAYTFTILDTLTDQTDGAWGLSDSSLTITGSAFSVEELQPGMTVRIMGRIMEDGRWVVDSIHPVQSETTKASFVGAIEEINDGTWTVGGISVEVNPSVKRTESLKVGDVVRVVGSILKNGTWRAHEIAAVEDGISSLLTVTLTAIEEPTTTSTLEQVEEGLPAQEPSVVAPLTVPECLRAEAPTDAFTLAERYGVTVAEIMGWFCEGFGFGEIDLAYGLSSGQHPVSEIFAMRSSGMGWGAIKEAVATPSPKKVVPTDKPTKEPKPTKTEKPVDVTDEEEDKKPTKTPKP